jgi:hypothetical protein
MADGVRHAPSPASRLPFCLCLLVDVAEHLLGGAIKSPPWCLGGVVPNPIPQSLSARLNGLPRRTYILLQFAASRLFTRALSLDLLAERYARGPTFSVRRH